MLIVRRRVLVALLVLAPGLSAGGWALFLSLTGNIHAISPGVAYRSAQLDSSQLAETIDRFGIRAVINLRGDNAGEPWYADERAVAAQHGARHYDIGMYAKSEPPPETLKRVLEVLRVAPRPLLIHCYGGADRSGLVAAIYKHFVEGEPVDEAERQLSFLYGHFPWIGGTDAMDKTFRRLTASDGRLLSRVLAATPARN
ncbi:tyrosine-protein phosphatase [Rhodoplanes azumiensis]|uniref:Tyrosine-protein phosphatase n=1 Tax=Rhodoplanes azumiensis TaxID=1897628 RepID=A0ABW5AFH8_9BRAD